MIGGVTHWGGLSGLKCWNSDNFFDWIDFFKTNTYFHFFFWRKSERETKTANFLETRSFSLWRMLISLNQNAEDEVWSLFFYILTRFFFFYWISFFFLLNFTLLCSLDIFSCAQQILIAWTSCLKLIISKIYLLWLLLPKQHLWMKKYISLQQRKKITLNSFFCRTLICIT